MPMQLSSLKHFLEVLDRLNVVGPGPPQSLILLHIFTYLRKFPPAAQHEHTI
ncbi:uncharacterized protein PGTG_22110 [Puccinia graminis f. sp. tritici CRL 75-36-700-3]|uniref:Uncharacterized protein n=1 Tax=Puccinia graminis f. sp. tritici (strain CRL 75-36-700-3 / race SCCL) TaxID=418459 RepID=H6QTA5_PUCGT|nr:uncharacterized protein PGTG_22110 [Puccinia graminis f. sp. tritici CRL 75-36-700-3]EHS64055.1 hypothetical protein PGTG_22110 [Puccinia graminis f. sp. tritici CRL 75-36-700-3]